MVKIKKGILAIIVAASVLTGCIGGVFIGHFQGASPDKKLHSLRQTIEKLYYIEPSRKALEEETYKGLVRGLGDEYSEYMTKSEYDSWVAGTTGSYEGVGLIFSKNKKTGKVVVVQVVKNSPAENNGIKTGDNILKVGGKTYKDVEKMATAIRGKAGSTVDIVFAREGKAFTKKLTRAAITMETVSTKQLDNNIGYISISAFESATAQDFKEALQGCEKKHNKGVIIDLRDNGGGLVQSSVEIADMLMDKSVVTYMEDRKGKKDYYRAHDGSTKLPYVLLVNGHTASASEILMAAVMDNTKNKVVGTKTYGKGIVQDIYPLQDGSALKLTVKQYFSPKGKVIHKKGIAPNYIVKGGDAQLKKAKEVLR